MNENWNWDQSVKNMTELMSDRRNWGVVYKVGVILDKTVGAKLSIGGKSAD